MPIQPEVYENLVEKLFDDRLSGDELQQLNHVLRQSPEAREHYWHLVMLEGYLTDLPGWIAGQQYATQLAFSETLEAFIEMESNAEAELQTYPPPTELVIEKEQITWQDVRVVSAFCIRSLARQKVVWGVAAAAMICIVALVYANWFAGGSSQPTQQPVADAYQEPTEASPVPVEPVPVAVVLNQLEAAEGGAQNTVAPGTKLAAGHAITLQADNAMHLEYNSGVRVILQGPGTFELLSASRIGMGHGRLTAVVPPKGKGFTVSTKQTDFIDHGTEFAVELDEAGHGEVVVLDGLIEARQSDSEPESNLAQGMMLREGIVGRIIPDAALPESIQPIDRSQRDRYVRSWDDVIYRPEISGQITFVAEPPASLDTGLATSENPLLIPEQRSVILTEALNLNPDKTNRAVIQKLGLEVEPQQDYVIAAGTKLDSFLIHFDVSDDGIPGVIEREFKIQFKGRIIGLIERHDYHLKTDGLFGIDVMHYPAETALRGAADPPGHPNYDVIWISDDLRTMSVKMRLSGMDQIRVLVESPDP